MTDFFHAAPKTDRETSGGETVTEPDNNEQQSRVSALSGGCTPRDTVPSAGRAYAARRGKFSSSKQLAKAEAFWQHKTALRKTLGNCGRCGKRNPDQTHKHCPACRDYQKRRKFLRRIEPVVVSMGEVRRLVRRVESLELSVARLSLRKDIAYRSGYRAAQRHERKLRYASDVTITKQELATMNHAYDHGDRQ